MTIGKRGSTSGDYIAETGAEQCEMVEIALDYEGLPLLPDGVFCRSQSEKHLALAIDG